MNNGQLPFAVENQWTRKKIKFEGFCLSYLEGGKKSDRLPLLFLPGWGVSTEPYRDCLNTLAQRYWVIAPDLPGFGRSHYSRPLTSYQAYANCILQLIKQLNLSNFQLIGHSFGGGVALAIAATIPHQVEKLIVISSTGIPFISIPHIIRRRVVELPRQLSQLRSMPFFRIMGAFLHNLVFHRQHLIQAARIALQEDMRIRLEKVKSPCLVLWGERDYFTPVELGYSLVETIPNSQWQLVQSGYHEWCMMQPVKLALIAFNFFDPIEFKTRINYESVITSNPINYQRDRHFTG